VITEVDKTDSHAEPFAVKARYVFPVAGPPLPGGVVTIRGSKIVAVGSQSDNAPVEDLGNVAILPGLINAHTHLEFSRLEAPIGEPGIGFVDWVGKLVELIGHWDHVSGDAVEVGLAESARFGTTTLADIARPGRPSSVYTPIGPDAAVFLELIALSHESVNPILGLARAHLKSAQLAQDWRVGLSPHAPYTVQPELLESVVALSAVASVPLAFHLAESPEELQLLRNGTGPFRDLLVKLAAWDDRRIRSGTRPMDYLRQLSMAHRALIIHGNYLDDEEIAFLGKRSGQMAVVYCPRTHAFFRHAPYPLEKLLAVGARVAVGTDGRASAPDLNLMAELRTVAARHEAVARETVLHMGTIDAARALGMAPEIGTLEAGKAANLTVLALPDREADDPHDLLFDSNKPVVATWRRGRKNDGWA